jgi:hypothetical protein
VLGPTRERDIHKKWRSAQPVVCVICIVPTAQSQRWCSAAAAAGSRLALGEASLWALFSTFYLGRPLLFYLQRTGRPALTQTYCLLDPPLGHNINLPAERFCAWTIPFMSVFLSLCAGRSAHRFFAFLPHTYAQ